MFKNQGTSLPVASQYVNGDMAEEWEELVELDDVQLATVVGGLAGFALNFNIIKEGGKFFNIIQGQKVELTLKDGQLLLPTGQVLGNVGGLGF